MDIAVIGAGIAGLSAAWSLRRGGHRVQVFERNYKAGGRLNSRRKAGLVVDHGQRFINRGPSVLRDLILDCGLHGEMRSIDKPIYHMAADGSFLESPEEAVDPRRVSFTEGLLMLPEALRRTVGGIYSIRVTSVEWNEEAKKYRLKTDPPMREEETLVDAVVVACAAPEALRITKQISDRINETFLQALERVVYTPCIVLIAALERVQPRYPFYGLYPPESDDALISWIAFEDQKCPGREVEGWTSIVVHMTPEASERCWDLDEDTIQRGLYGEACRLLPHLPRKWRWARSKRWEIASLKDAGRLVDHTEFPAAPPETLVEFCGDYRAGDGAEKAAASGRKAAESLLEKLKAISE